MVLPLAVVPLAIIVGSLVPGGWVFNPGHMQPKLERFNPIAHLGRIFSTKHASEVLTPIAKSVVLCLVLYVFCRDSVERYVSLQAMTLDQALVFGAGLLSDGVMSLCTVFIIFALIDVPLQTFMFLRGQRMSKRELKEEYKESEGSPEIKQRIRQLQRQFARRSVRKSVPDADAVIVNPEHYAVAIRYDEKRSDAPFVVAKGMDEMALYIKEVAAEHEVPVITMPPLARAIYHTSQINQQIPVALYRAVAQVLNYVLQLKAFRSGRRQSAPHLPDVAVPSHLT
jgi:flagellar biosynthetic protein FlhB